MDTQRPGKPVSASRTEQAQILMYDTLNGYKRLFGGRLMEWIDVVAAVVARRHSGRAVTTASVDTLTFTAPAFVDDTVILETLEKGSIICPKCGETLEFSVDEDEE